MTRVLVDITVVLDVLLDRRPHATAAATVWTAIETGQIEGFLSADAFTTIDYLVCRELGARRARTTVAALLRVFRVAAVDQTVLQEALASSFSDFEDAVTAAAARASGCDAIVTRDPKGFRTSPVRALTPEAAAHLIASR